MSLRNSQIIICKDIKLDREHKNVLNYTTNQMLTLVNSTGVYVASRNNFSFIRRNGTIAADFPYAQSIICNYMAFQNPDFSNKWFFAWIDNIEYKSDSSIEISYTIDHWATWYDVFTFNPCLIDRMHVADDTFTKWLKPEPVSSNNIIPVYQSQSYFDVYDLIVVFIPVSGVDASDLPYNIDNKYLSPCRFYRYDVTTSGITALTADLADATVLGGADIVSVFMYPHSLIPAAQQLTKWLTGGSVSIDKPMPVVTDLDGYVPQNKKMFAHPFNYVEIDNGSSKADYRYEFFYIPNGQIEAAFSISGAALPDGNISVYPVGYNGKTGKNPFYSITISDMPQVAIPIDTYAAWLAQHGSIALSQGLINAFEKFTGAGGASAGLIGAGQGALSEGINYQRESMQARAASDHASGINSASLDMINGLQGFNFKRMCVRAEDAKSIDHFLSMYGYNISDVMTPNITSRQYWNYIRTAEKSITGPMPQNIIEAVNAVLNSGVTIWHDHSYMLNYFVGGSDMQNPII